MDYSCIESSRGGRVISEKNIANNNSALVPSKTDTLLEDKLHQFKFLVENNPDMVSILDENNIFIYQNAASEKIIGYKPEELIGRHNLEFLHPEDIHRINDIRKKLKKNSLKNTYNDFRYRHKNGSWIYLDSFERNLLDNPAIRGRVFYSRDVTKRRQMEGENRRSRAVFETSFNVNHTINTITDPTTGEFFDVNDAWVNILGWPREEVIGHYANEFNLWGSPENRSRVINKIIKNGYIRDFETQLYPRNGKPRDILLSAEILEIMGKERLFLSAADITEKKRADEKLKASEKRFRHLFNNAEISIWDQDFSTACDELEILRANGLVDLEKYLTDNVAEAYRLAELVVINSVNDATLELYDVPSWEAFTKTLSGMMNEDTIHVFIGALVAFWNGDDYYSTEISHKTIIGRDITVILSIPIPKTKDEYSHIPVSVLDITERKRIEQQSRRSQKMEAVGQLTGGIAHDFNNILGIVMGNLELLEARIADDPLAMERLRKAMKGVGRGAEITRKLLGFSRKNTEDLSVTKLNIFIDTIKDLIAKSLTASIQVKTHLAADLWNVTVDLGDLEDALLNVSLNAKDAMPHGGVLTIETSNKTLDDLYVRQNVGSRAGDFVVISISDTGEGMSESVRDKVLEPFFTTKETGKGTGLGLSIVYGFVQRSGGHMKIYSEVNIGTTIRLYLPRTDIPSVSARNVDRKIVEMPTGTETILVIDDEEVLRDIAATILRGLGYNTLIGSNSKDALKMLDEHSDIKLLFSDVIMPGDMDGYDLALYAHAAYPDLQILLTSGFNKHRDEKSDCDDKFLSQINALLLDKPYNRSELAFAVRKILDGKTESD